MAAVAYGDEVLQGVGPADAPAHDVVGVESGSLLSGGSAFLAGVPVAADARLAEFAPCVRVSGTAGVAADHAGSLRWPALRAATLGVQQAAGWAEASHRSFLAGTPAHVSASGMSWRTTAPWPAIAAWPMVTWSRIWAPGAT